MNFRLFKRKIKEEDIKFLKSFEDFLIKKVDGDILAYYKLLFECYKNNLLNVEEYKDRVKCKYCGGERALEKVIKNGFATFCSQYCSTQDNRGKKRPEHSKLMKSYFKSGKLNKKNSFLKCLNKELNTLNFKKKVIENRGYSTIGLSDEEIISLHGKVNGEIQRSTKSIKAKIKRFLLNKKYIYLDIYKNSILCGMNEEDIDKIENLDYLRDINRITNSIKSIIAMKNNPLMGSSKIFKRVVKENLKFNIRGLDLLVTRSSYESNYIDYFEKEKIYWDYENIYIPCKSGNYVPDFIINIGDDNYIIEAKGSFFRTTLEEYCDLKLTMIDDFCSKNDNNKKN